MCIYGRLFAFRWKFEFIASHRKLHVEAFQMIYVLKLTVNVGWRCVNCNHRTSRAEKCKTATVATVTATIASWLCDGLTAKQTGQQKGPTIYNTPKKSLVTFIFYTRENRANVGSITSFIVTLVCFFLLSLHQFNIDRAGSSLDYALNIVGLDVLCC